MRSDTDEAGWHRFLGGWLERWRRPVDGIAATPANAKRAGAPRNSEALDVWEDEGGSVKSRASVPKDVERTVRSP